jgi:hypothetical protein
MKDANADAFMNEGRVAAGWRRAEAAHHEGLGGEV